MTRAGALFAAGAVAWGWFEAGWARLATQEVTLPGLPAELDGLRIAHLSDFHLGVPSRGSRAVEVGVEWAEQRAPDLVAITGDLLSRRAAASRRRRRSRGSSGAGRMSSPSPATC